ncbi:porin family protein [Sphingobacterium bambusae]|uniref:Porin family protein n=1 Tax=Sphingobacterium bambusae TaxID=662858 RepID=A0ABW6BMW9_9SPHI|nr:porin family protein [Sphingobacterium bambusae]WPL47700.1 porin family protein [Sphingobacterium bambusae]
MKRKLLSIATVLCCIAGAHAQTSFGVKAGVNFAKLTVNSDRTTYTSDAATSFYVTGYADMPVVSNLRVQPGVSLQGKGGAVPASDSGFEEKVKDTYMYIEVPINLVYYVPTGEFGDVFFGAGPYAGYGIHAKSSQGNLSESGSFNDAGLKPFDAGVNFLAGFKMSQGFLINAGYGLGLTNIAKEAPGTTVKNRAFSVGVGFQF